MSAPLSIDHPIQYSSIVGTGGIGSGKFFVLNGSHTLGREESRSGRFLDVRDYCKQHIILHYLSVLLGDRVKVFPIGRVGNDETGQSLLSEMREAGLVLDYVQSCPDLSTLFSFCFHYPDGSGGNLTTDNSASAAVDRSFICRAEGVIREYGRSCMIVAAPEVPVDARAALLELGRRHSAFCTASFTSEEIAQADKDGLMYNIDLLAINADEARAWIDGNENEAIERLVELCVARVNTRYPKMIVAITGGEKGSWCWDGVAINHVQSFPATVKSTAGAGDAFFAGLLAAFAAGCTPHEAQMFGALVASVSVTSSDSIHHGLDRALLRSFVEKNGSALPARVSSLLTTK